MNRDFEKFIVENVNIDKVALLVGDTTLQVGNDSKICSMIIQLQVINVLKRYCEAHAIKYLENTSQTSYPDFIIYDSAGAPIAIDVKTCIIKSPTRIAGFTLGTYKGYFRDRKSASCTVLPYEQYLKHYCISVMYARNEVNGFSTKGVVVNEKWRIASKRAGSGNTTNIGSTRNIQDILNNISIFETEDAFNEYWLNYGNESRKRQRVTF